MTAAAAVRPSTAAPGPALAAVKPSRRRRWKQALIGWSFALPFVLLFTVFMAGPILVSFVTSFTDLRSTDLRSPLSVNFVGLDNYADVFGDPQFRKAVVEHGGSL